MLRSRRRGSERGPSGDFELILFRILVQHITSSSGFFILRLFVVLLKAMGANGNRILG